MSLHILPLIIFVVFPASIILCYVISLGRDEIVPFFAYISDTGTYPPQSCIFGQLLNIIAVLMGFLIFLRYKQVQAYFSEKHDCTLSLNKVAFILGVISAFGVSVVGNFQETNVISVHIIGAAMAFGIGSLYLILQAILSFKLVPAFNSKGLAVIRLVIGILCTILFTITLLAGAVSASKFTGDNFTKWKPEHGGWELHVISVVSEWIMASLFTVYIVSFYGDMRKMSYHGPQVTLRIGRV